MLQAIGRVSCRPLQPTPRWRVGIGQLRRSFASSPIGCLKGNAARTKTIPVTAKPQRSVPSKTKTAAVVANKAVPAATPRPPLPPPPPSAAEAVAPDKLSTRHGGRTNKRANETPESPNTKGPGTPAPLSRVAEKFAYPERLLIYHAGTGRTIFLSCIKLSGIFLIIFTGLFVAPAYYFSPAEPTYLAFVYLAGSCIPLALMTFTAPPFVTYVHLKLPTWARHSAARLQRYTQALPSTSELDVTSLKWIWPRVTRLNAAELYLHQGQLSGAMTLRREVPRHVAESRKWYAWRPIKKFYVGGKAGKKSAEPWVWEGVVGAVARGYPKATLERRGRG